MKVLPWILLVIGICVIIWLIFRPVPSTDNKQALHTIDSLTQENLAYKHALNATEATYKPKIDSLVNISVSVGLDNDILSGKITDLLNTNSKLSENYEILRNSGQPIDSICELAMRRIPIDSAIIVHYQENNSHLIAVLGQVSSAKDSIILAQHRLILSDSVLIQNQATLNKTQETELKKIKASAKVNAWLARSLAVTAGVLFILFETK
jgi:hypothetical protein